MENKSIPASFEVLNSCQTSFQTVIGFMLKNIKETVPERAQFIILPYIEQMQTAFAHKIGKTKAFLENKEKFEEDARVTTVGQIWTNIWIQRDATIFSFDPFLHSVVRSYDDAMEDIDSRGTNHTSGKVQYDYLCTYFHHIDKGGKTVDFKVYYDLPDELASWKKETKESWEDYHSAATLSAHQLCSVG
jgi:hypothetical protein